MVEIGVEPNSGMPIGAKQVNGQGFDYSGNPVNIDHLSLTDTWAEYLLLYGENSDFVFGTNFGFAMYNVVCEKAPQVGGKLTSLC